MLENHLKTVRTDMRSLIRDAQELFREATGSSGAKADELREKGMSLLDSAITRAQDIQEVALETGKEAVDATDSFVRENPWRAVAISAGIGLVLGVLVARR